MQHCQFLDATLGTPHQGPHGDIGLMSMRYSGVDIYSRYHQITPENCVACAICTKRTVN